MRSRTTKVELHSLESTRPLWTLISVNVNIAWEHERDFGASKFQLEDKDGFFDCASWLGGWQVPNLI